MFSPAAATRPNLSSLKVPLILLALLAFLLASAPAMSSSVWWHMGEGRRLLQTGNMLSPGPGGSGSASWCYDLLMGVMAGVLPVEGAVLLHALIAAAVVLVLFNTDKQRLGLVYYAVALVAVLAMNLQNQPHPGHFSLLLAAVLVRLCSRAAAVDFTPRSMAPLAVLFLIWANSDRWFLAGLIYMVVTVLTRLLQLNPSQRKATLGRSLGALGVCVGVCVLNPTGLGAFSLPVELTTARLGSPFSSAYHAYFAAAPVSLAFYPLLGAALLALLLSERDQRGQGLGIVLLFAGLACWEASAIPMFAVLTSRFSAQTLSDFVTRQQPVARREAQTLAQFLAAGLAILFTVVAWPGWLQRLPYGPRQWTIEAPKELLVTAQTVGGWYQRGLLKEDDQVLHLSTDTAHAFAWGAPRVKSLLDSQLAAALRTGKADQALSDKFQQQRIRLVVVSLPTDGNEFSAVRLFLMNPIEWPLLQLKGRVWVFGHRESLSELGPNDPLAGIISAVASPENQMQPVPEANDIVEKKWTDAFVKKPLLQTTDRDEANNFLRVAQTVRPQAVARHEQEWFYLQFAGLAAASTSWASPASITDPWFRMLLTRTQISEPAGLQLIQSLRSVYLNSQDASPPPVLYETIRSARRAIAYNPADSDAYLTLGEAYLSLLQFTRERGWSKAVPELTQLRQAQAVTALNRAVMLAPNNFRAHYNLAGIYRADNVLDLALVHATRYTELAPPSKTTPAFPGLSNLRLAVAEREKRFLAESENRRINDRVDVAIKLGLAGMARDLMLKSDVAAFGPSGALTELELLLRTGRAHDVRDWDLKELTVAFDQVLYRWLRIQAFAATGRYTAAIAEADLIPTAINADPDIIRNSMAGLVGQLVLENASVMENVPLSLFRAQREFDVTLIVSNIATQMKSKTTRDLLKGLLAFESGDLPQARSSLELLIEESPVTSARVGPYRRSIGVETLVWIKNAEKSKTP